MTEIWLWLRFKNSTCLNPVKIWIGIDDTFFWLRSNFWFVCICLMWYGTVNKLDLVVQEFISSASKTRIRACVPKLLLCLSLPTITISTALTSAHASIQLTTGLLIHQSYCKMMQAVYNDLAVDVCSFANADDWDEHMTLAWTNKRTEKTTNLISWCVYCWQSNLSIL